MKKTATKRADTHAAETKAHRPKRADAQRKMSSLLLAAVEVFKESGVDAPVREIAERAGVGIGTVYRHFPQRSDLIKAVFQSRVDACADAASELAGQHEPGDALARWMQRYVDFIATKRGLAAALHSGDPAYSALPGLFNTRLLPALKTLLGAAVAAGAVRSGIDAEELLHAVANLCRVSHEEEPAYARRIGRIASGWPPLRSRKRSSLLNFTSKRMAHRKLSCDYSSAARYRVARSDQCTHRR